MQYEMTVEEFGNQMKDSESENEALRKELAHYQASRSKPMRVLFNFEVSLYAVLFCNVSYVCFQSNILEYFVIYNI